MNLSNFPRNTIALKTRYWLMVGIPIFNSNSALAKHQSANVLGENHI